MTVDTLPNMYSLPKDVKLQIARRSARTVLVDRIGHIHIGGDTIVFHDWEDLWDELDGLLWLLEWDTVVHIYTRYTRTSRWNGDVFQSFDITWDVPDDTILAFTAEFLIGLPYRIRVGEELP